MRSTAPRPRYKSPNLLVSRGISGWRRSALIHREAGWHAPVGHRHSVALRLKSVPANVHVPCSQLGGRWSPRLTPGVSRSGTTGWQNIHGTHAPRKTGDMGIDGFSFFERLPIQVKQSDSVGRNVVDNFETAIRRTGKHKG